MTITFRIIIASTLVLLAGSAWSASTKQEVQELQSQVESLQKGQEDIKKDLEEIKKLLREGAGAAPGQPAFKEQVVDVGLSPFKGDVGATVTLIEFSDYQCPFCSRHYREVLPTLEEEYVNTGKLKYVMRENPIASIHPDATNASLAALCAHNEGKYWEMHDIIFDNQQDLSVSTLKSFAVEIGLNATDFDSCLDSKKYEPWVNADLKSAGDVGVRGTPGFILGLTDPDDPDKAFMSVYIKGAQSLDNFKRAIDGLLDSVE